MSQNGQPHLKNFAKNNARFLKCVWPFWDAMHQRDKRTVKGDNSWDNKQNVVQIQQNNL